MSSDVIATLQNLYESVDDIDLTVGGNLENKISGSTVGPTFSCIIANQFYHSKVGDRFLYENTGTQGDCEFTDEQIAEIKKVSLAKVYCNQAPGVTKMQAKIFELVSTKNPLVDCSSLPYIDFSKWKDSKCVV